MINQPVQEQVIAANAVKSYTENVKKRSSSEPKPSMSVKRAWHDACFHPRDRRGSDRKWKRIGSAWMPLKAFARKMTEAVGQTWLNNK